MSKTMTAYDQSVKAAMSQYVKERRIREAEEYIAKEQASHKPAARAWFNFLTEVWSPELTESYFAKVNEAVLKASNEDADNELLQMLLIVTHEYLGKVAKRRNELENATEVKII